MSAELALPTLNAPWAMSAPAASVKRPASPTPGAAVVKSVRLATALRAPRTRSATLVAPLARSV